jgi:putative tricarboxylic transport membrane protein
MDLLSNLALGFGVAFTVQNLLYAFAGCVLGTLIGVLPGLGPVATIAMLLPSIYGLDATPALIMLAGIYYGAQYGGSTTAILINVPGESSSVVTAIDGYQRAALARHWRPPAWARSSQAAWAPSSLPPSRRRSPSWPSSSARKSISR